jgi:hypothetical protein
MNLDLEWQDAVAERRRQEAVWEELAATVHLAAMAAATVAAGPSGLSKGWHAGEGAVYKACDPALRKARARLDYARDQEARAAGRARAQKELRVAQA